MEDSLTMRPKSPCATFDALSCVWPAFLFTALAATGQFDEAVRTGQEALEQARARDKRRVILGGPYRSRPKIA